jgi:hypothetical protein
MRWPTRIPAAALLLAALAPSLATATMPGSPLGFGPTVLVTPAGSGEPSLAIGPDGALYVSTLGDLQDDVFTSADQGASWQQAILPTDFPVGGDDDHIAVAPDNTVVLVGQWIAPVPSGCMAVALGPMGGTAWATQPVACNPLKLAGIFVDRPWLAVSNHPASIAAPYRVYLYFHDPCCAGRHVVMRSDTLGLSWTQVGTPFAAGQGGFPGNVVVDDAANWVYTVTLRGSVRLARSADLGATWEQRAVASVTSGDGGLNHVFLAKDAAGNLYTAWADNRDGTGTHIWLARSTDLGNSWSAPTKVSATAGTHIYPTLAAGSVGRVVVAWYETSAPGNPNTLPASAVWSPKAAGSWDADAASPSWTYAPVSADPNHQGPLCTQGAACGGNRRLLDFFTVQVDGADNADVVWADDTAGNVEVKFARST